MTIKVSTIKDKFVTDVYCAENVTIDISSPVFYAMDSSVTPELAGIRSNIPKDYKGNYFLIDMTTFLFFHTMNEGVAQYLLLKDIVPDLKIVPIFLPNVVGNNTTVVDFYLDILKPFNIKEENIIILTKVKPTFEKVYYYTTRVNSFLEKFEIPQGNELYNITPHFSGGYHRLKNLYQTYLKKDDILPKKIFLSRLNKDDTTRRLHDLSFNYEMYDDSVDQELLQTMHNYGSKGHFDQMLRERYISRDDQERLEKFFIKNGYTSIDPETLSFFEQINYYYNATHIVSMRGSALLNTIFCDADTKIFILDTNALYTFPYKEICELFDHEVYEIPFELNLKKFMPWELFSVKNILGIIKTHYSDRI